MYFIFLIRYSFKTLTQVLKIQNNTYINKIEKTMLAVYVGSIGIGRRPIRMK